MVGLQLLWTALRAASAGSTRSLMTYACQCWTARSPTAFQVLSSSSGPKLSLLPCRVAVWSKPALAWYVV